MGFDNRPVGFLCHLLALGVLAPVVTSCRSQAPVASLLEAATCPQPVIAIDDYDTMEGSRRTEIFADGSALLTTKRFMLPAATTQALGHVSTTSLAKAIAMWKDRKCCALGTRGGDTAISVKAGDCEVVRETEEIWRREAPACWAAREQLTVVSDRPLDPPVHRCTPSAAQAALPHH